MAELLRYAVGSSRRTACEQKAATYASVSMRLLSSGIPAFASFLLPEAGPRSGSVKKAPDEHTEEAQDRNSQVHCADQSRDLESQEGDSQRKRVFDEVEIDIPIFELPAEFVQRFELLFSAFGKNDPTAESYACAIIESLMSSQAEIIQTFKLIWSSEFFLQKLVASLDSSSVCSLIRSSLVGIRKEQDREYQVEDDTLYYRLEIFHMVANLLLESEEPEVVANASTIIKQLIYDREVIIRSAYIIKMVLLGDRYFDKLMARLVSNFRAQNKHVFAKINKEFISVAQEIILYCTYNEPVQPSEQVLTPTRKMSLSDVEILPDTNGQKKEAVLLSLLENKIAQLVGCLPGSLEVGLDEQGFPEFLSTAGVQYKAVGSDVLFLAKTLNSLYVLESEIIENVFLETDYILKLQRLFFERHSNSLVHNVYLEAILSALRRINTRPFQQVAAADQIFEDPRLMADFTKQMLSFRRKDSAWPKLKDRPLFYAQSIKIGEALYGIHRNQNSVGFANQYFESDDWRLFLDKMVKPELSIWDKELGGRRPNRVLESKASIEGFNDYLEGSDCRSGLDDALEQGLGAEERSGSEIPGDNSLPTQLITPGIIETSMSPKHNKTEIQDFLKAFSQKNGSGPN